MINDDEVFYHEFDEPFADGWPVSPKGWYYINLLGRQRPYGPFATKAAAKAKAKTLSMPSV
jgi:hypothetical protein